MTKAASCADHDQASQSSAKVADRAAPTGGEREGRGALEPHGYASMIGGALEYQRRAEANRPSDREAFAGEVRRLFRNGLTACDIASALRVALPAVKEMLGSGGQAA